MVREQVRTFNNDTASHALEEMKITPVIRKKKKLLFFLNCKLILHCCTSQRIWEMHADGVHQNILQPCGHILT